MSREELKKLSTKQLKAKCKELGLKGYSRLKEDELIDLILDSEAADNTETDELDELLDGADDSEVETEEESGEDDSEVETEEESGEDDSEVEGSLVVFKKLIKGPFGFMGRTFKGSTFELSAEEAKHKKIQNAIDCKIIEIK